MCSEEHSWDIFSDREAEFVGGIMHDLSGAEWARPLFADIERNGGLTRANKGRFFELRFGYAMHQAGIARVMRCRAKANQRWILDSPAPAGTGWSN